MTSRSALSHRLRVTGFWSLFGWGLLGLLLESAHGLKLAWLLDDPLRQSLLRLAHAHGVGLSLLLLVYAAAGGGSHGPQRGTGRWLLAASCLLPAGFALGALWHYEADPGLGIALSPLGGLCLLCGLWRAAREVSAE